MAGILIAHTRFVDVQRRRARIAAELSQLRETEAPRPEPAATGEPVDVGGPPLPDFDANSRCGVVDG